MFWPLERNDTFVFQLWNVLLINLLGLKLLETNLILILIKMLSKCWVFMCTNENQSCQIPWKLDLLCLNIKVWAAFCPKTIGLSFSPKQKPVHPGWTATQYGSRSGSRRSGSRRHEGVCDDEKEHLGHWAITDTLHHNKWTRTYSPTLPLN